MHIILSCTIASKYILIKLFAALAALQSCSGNEGGMSVTVNGNPVEIHETRVSQWPVNQYWDGNQRNPDQAETAYFSTSDFKKGMRIRIDGRNDVRDCVIRPASLGIKTEIRKDGTIILKRIPGPCQFVVETDGYHNALHMFVNPADPYAGMDKTADDVIYFGAGEHECGKIELKSHQTLFIDEGAVVYGIVRCIDAEDVKIIGKGILDCSKMGRFDGNAVFLKNVSHAEISGIIINDPPQWTAIASRCDDVVFDNVKVIGAWRYNADGFNICNSRNVRIHNCFLRCFDDNIVIKGISGYYDEEHNVVEHVDVKNCVLWNDWGHALEIGAETVADEIRDIRFDSCDIIHFTFGALDIQNTDKAYIHDIHYSNINLEEPVYRNARLGDIEMSEESFGGLIGIAVRKSMYSSVETSGRVSNISFNNIHYTGMKKTAIGIHGLSPDADVRDIDIRNCFINGVKIDRSWPVAMNEYVSGVNIE